MLLWRLCILGSARLKIIVEHTFLGKRGREKRKEERANLLLSLPPPPPPPPTPSEMFSPPYPWGRPDTRGSQWGWCAVYQVIIKWICVLSDLMVSIWTRSICQMRATFPGVEFLRILFTFKNWGRKIRRRMSTSSIKRQISRFHVVVVQWTSKKCTKKHDARAELLF